MTATATAQGKGKLVSLLLTNHASATDVHCGFMPQLAKLILSITRSIGKLLSGYVKREGVNFLRFSFYCYCYCFLPVTGSLVFTNFENESRFFSYSDNVLWFQNVTFFQLLLVIGFMGTCILVVSFSLYNLKLHLVNQPG